jgi:hypothetical protein
MPFAENDITTMATEIQSILNDPDRSLSEIVVNSDLQQELTETNGDLDAIKQVLNNLF